MKTFFQWLEVLGPGGGPEPHSEDLEKYYGFLSQSDAGAFPTYEAPEKKYMKKQSKTKKNRKKNKRKNR